MARVPERSNRSVSGGGFTAEEEPARGLRIGQEVQVGVAASGAGVLVAGALAILAYNYAALRSRREKHELVQCAPAES